MSPQPRVADPLPVLRRMELFVGVSEDTIARVAAAMTPVSFAAGGVICHEGDPADAFYVAQTGTLLVTTVLGGQKHELARLGPGDFFGEVALIGGGVRTATVTALDPTDLWMLGAEEFWSLVAADEDLSDRVAERAQAREARSFEVTRRDLAGMMGDRSQLRIGRDRSNDLVLDSPLAAQFHAIIRRDGARFELVDLDTALGTFVNGRRVRSVSLKSRDEIGVGDASFFFDPAGLVQVTYPHGLRIDASGLRYEVKGGLELLHEVDLTILPGELVAVLGGSGAGKTTLLRALAGMTPPTNGAVQYNGHDAYGEHDRFKNMIGYVPQDDIVHTELSVRRTLDYAAQLRLPADTSRAERTAAIDETLGQLELVDRADLAVRRLSGGQRKRCSIGVELLTRPRAFFLDEPTSGLDPVTDAGTMQNLRELADAGSTVVITTHSTTNLGTCDRIVFLAPGGHLVYAGTPQSALDYFGTAHFDGIFKRLASEDTPGLWHERFRQQTQEKALRTEPEPAPLDDPEHEHPTLAPRRPRELLRQFAVLTRRNLEIHTRSAELVIPYLVQPFALSLLVMALFDGGLYREDAPNPSQYVQLLFLVVLVGFLVGLLNAVQEIVREDAVFRRERMVGLGVAPYVLSKVGFLAPALAVVDLVIIATLRLTNRLPPEGLSIYGALFATVFLATLGGMAVGLMTSSMVASPQRANDLLAIWIMPQVLFAGGLTPVDGMNVVGRAISHIAALRWAFEATGRSVHIDQVLSDNPSSLAAAIRSQHGDGFTVDLGPHLIILSVFTIVPLALAIAILRRRTRIH